MHLLNFEVFFIRNFLLHDIKFLVCLKKKLEILAHVFINTLYSSTIKVFYNTVWNIPHQFRKHTNV